jgi:hypothetical protein
MPSEGSPKARSMKTPFSLPRNNSGSRLRPSARLYLDRLGLIELDSANRWSSPAAQAQYGALEAHPTIEATVWRTRKPDGFHRKRPVNNHGLRTPIHRGSRPEPHRQASASGPRRSQSRSSLTLMAALSRRQMRQSATLGEKRALGTGFSPGVASRPPTHADTNAGLAGQCRNRRAIRQSRASREARIVAKPIAGSERLSR